MVNWKTTLGGILAAVGAFLVTVDDPSWLKFAGTVLSSLGALLMGTQARDKNVSSERSGAK